MASLDFVFKTYGKRVFSIYYKKLAVKGESRRLKIKNHINAHEDRVSDEQKIVYFFPHTFSFTFCCTWNETAGTISGFRGLYILA